MTRAFRIAAVLALVALLAAPALARDKDKKKKEGEVAAPATFQLQSRLLSQDPEIRAALDKVKGSPSPGAWNDLGQVLAGRGAYQDAYNAFGHAVRMDPSRSTYVSNQGAALLRLGDNDGALEAFERALAIEPFDAVAYYNLAVAHDKAGHYDAAIEAYKSAFLLDPTLSDPDRNPAVINNQHMMAIGLEVYLETAGGTPAIYQDAPNE